jgi:hypothetical protein
MDKPQWQVMNFCPKFLFYELSSEEFSYVVKKGITIVGILCVGGVGFVWWSRFWEGLYKHSGFFDGISVYAGCCGGVCVTRRLFFACCGVDGYWWRF